MKRRFPITLVIFILALATLAAAQDVASFEKRITVKKLPNGLTLIVCERPEALSRVALSLIEMSTRTMSPT